MELLRDFYVLGSLHAEIVYIKMFSIAPSSYNKLFYLLYCRHSTGSSKFLFDVHVFFFKCACQIYLGARLCALSSWDSKTAIGKSPT